MEIDPKTGKYKTLHRAPLPKPEGYVERERRPRPERVVTAVMVADRRPRRDGGDRGDRRFNGDRQPRRFEHREERQDQDYHDPDDWP